MTRTRRHITVTHLHGHCHNPWNELVDVIARQTADGQHPETPNAMNDLLTIANASKWQWILTLPPNERLQYPPDHNDHFLVTPQTTTPDITHIAHTQKLPQRVTATSTTIDIKIATANILTGSFSTTTKTVEVGQVPGRIQLILDQAHTEGVHILFLHEVRAPEEDTRSPTDYHIIFTASQNGNYGEAIAISKTLPYATTAKTRHYLDPKAIHLIISQPRRLLAHYADSHYQCFLLGLHGPSILQPTDYDKALQYWTDTSQLVTKHCPPQVPLIGGMDSNSPLGSIQSDFVGPINAEEQTIIGDIVHDFLRKHKLTLPATKIPQPDDGKTWTSPDGLTQKRHDHIFTSEDPTLLAHSPKLATHIDLSLARQDHAVPTLRITGWVDAQHHITRSAPALTYDVTKLKDPQTLANIATDLQQAPIVEWTTDVNTHASTIEDYVLATLETHCPKDRQTPRKPWLSQTTLQTALVKHRQFRLLVNDPRRWHRYTLQTIMYFWRAYTQNTFDSDTLLHKSHNTLKLILTTQLRAQTTTTTHIHHIFHSLQDTLRPTHKHLLSNNMWNILAPQVTHTLNYVRHFTESISTAQQPHITRTLARCHTPTRPPPRHSTHHLRTTWIPHTKITPQRHQTIQITTTRTNCHRLLPRTQAGRVQRYTHPAELQQEIQETTHQNSTYCPTRKR